MKKLLSITAIILFGLTITAGAKTLTLKHVNGAKVKIKCNHSVCFSTHYTAAGLEEKPVKAVGGSIGYFELAKKWKAKGYK